MSTAILIINRQSGSYTPDAEDRLAQGFEAAGSPLLRTIDCSEDGLPDAKALDEAGIEMLAVFGGDGTINSALKKVRGWSGNILVLPGGTANLLSHTLHGDSTAGEILSRLGDGKLVLRETDCIQGREWIALSEVLGGPGSLWADVREEMREHDVIDMATKAVEAIQASQNGPLVRVFSRHREIGRPEGYAGVRISPAKGALLPQGYRIERPAEFVQQGAAILARNFREGPYDELESNPEIVFQSTANTALQLMIDGERFNGQSQERFALAPLGLSLLGSPV